MMSAIRGGTSAWLRAPSGDIDGYVSEPTVKPGDQLHFHVNAPGNRYRLELYRLGWYGGAGARLLTCLPACDADEAGATRPTPARKL